MTRTDRASRVVAAPPAAVYAALTDRAALEAWLPPAGMRGRVGHWDPRPDGGFRMELTHLDATGAPGKSTDETDVVEVGLADLVAAQRVVWRTEFVAEDPAYSGIMTMTWSLAAAPAGCEVVVTAVDVPPGIEPGVHEEAMASSLAHLAAFVEQ